MNDIRRSILWVVFGFSMVLIWDKWQIHNGNKPTFFPSAALTEQAAPGAVPPQADNSLPVAAAGAAASGDAAMAPTGSSGPTAQAVRTEVTTDVYKLTFNSDGGSLVRAQLTQHAADRHTRKELTDLEKRVVAAEKAAKKVSTAKKAAPRKKAPVKKAAATRAS